MLDTLPIEVLERISNFLENPEILWSVSRKIADKSILLKSSFKIKNKNFSYSEWISFAENLSKTRTKIKTLSFSNCNITSYALTKILKNIQPKSLKLHKCNEIVSDEILIEQFVDQKSLFISNCNKINISSHPKFLPSYSKKSRLIKNGLISSPKRPNSLLINLKNGFDIIPADEFFTKKGHFSELETLSISGKVKNWKFLNGLKRLRHLFITETNFNDEKDSICSFLGCFSSTRNMLKSGNNTDFRNSFRFLFLFDANFSFEIRRKVEKAIYPAELFVLNQFESLFKLWNSFNKTLCMDSQPKIELIKDGENFCFVETNSKRLNDNLDRENVLDLLRFCLNVHRENGLRIFLDVFVGNRNDLEIIKMAKIFVNFGTDLSYLSEEESEEFLKVVLEGEKGKIKVLEFLMHYGIQLGKDVLRKLLIISIQNSHLALLSQICKFFDMKDKKELSDIPIKTSITYKNSKALKVLIKATFIIVGNPLTTSSLHLSVENNFIEGINILLPKMTKKQILSKNKKLLTALQIAEKLNRNEIRKLILLFLNK